VKARRVLSMLALLRSMSGVDRDPGPEGDMAGGCLESVVCAALCAWVMRDLAMALAASRPCGCLKTSDRSAGGSRGSDGRSNSRSGVIVVVSRSPVRRGEGSVVGGQVKPPASGNSHVRSRRLTFKRDGEDSWSRRHVEEGRERRRVWEGKRGREGREERRGVGKLAEVKCEGRAKGEVRLMSRTKI
jgi:hypothetical protein